VADFAEWKFQYITIGNYKEDAMAIKLMQNNEIVKETNNTEEVSILTRYVTICDICLSLLPYLILFDSPYVHFE
jgi:hypothetical protein